VAGLANAMLADGLGQDDRIAAYMPNIPETVVVALATAAIGATFCSCAPDFGLNGILDRYGQVEPTVLFAADGYRYNGKEFRSTGNLAQMRAGLPSVKRMILVPYLDPPAIPDGVTNAVLLDDYVAGHDTSAVPYNRVPFSHPLFILFSSGTTGKPKCILHRVGGSLIQGMKEAMLHHDVHHDDRVLFYTSTNWVIWNVHLSYLSAGAAMLTYEGSPLYPDPEVLFDYAANDGATLFGSSAKFVDSLRQRQVPVGERYDLSKLRTLLTSGSTLVEESFDYILESIKEDIHIAPTSGGTDVMCGFTVPDASQPVWRGEMQCIALGMAVEVWDDDGKRLPVGEAGELVCIQPFPSLPIGFVGDTDGSRYSEAYYEHFPGVWRHGDHMTETKNGGYYIFGRSDATLNPGGIRIGTAEIYRQVELLDEVVEAIAIGQEWDNDTRIVLFLVLAEGLQLDEALEAAIRKQIRDNTTPRHVPARIVQVPEIPRTKTGKIVELAVREVVHGRPVKNMDALLNPDALKNFEGLKVLAE
jgi:acetoacetyl-CoA synthetase